MKSHLISYERNMKFYRHLVYTFAALSIAVASVGAFANHEGGEKGPEYSRLADPQPTESSGKVEVIEFLWYGCPHCNSLEPLVEAWQKRLPKDVVFRREHVLWDGRTDMEGHAKLFVTLRAMGLLEKHHRAAFDAIHRSKLELRQEAALLDWVAKQGIDRSKFEATYKSFAVNAQTGRAKTLTKNYRVAGVPTFVINGKYVTSPSSAGGEDRLFAVIDKLIADERVKK